ncbi:LPXTG cell wall anchor domain-containing protein [Paenibacillus lentus]|uniref:LPXTG cell wall anchor domain-containing protein n=1 Tax=Paenibacillus lentus TaxID=1338368 RepID=UPI003CCC476C
MIPTPAPSVAPVTEQILPDTEPEDRPPTSNPEITEKVEEVSLDTLPKTGESSSLPYYIVGLATAIVGFVLRRTSKKSN